MIHAIAVAALVFAALVESTVAGGQPLRPPTDATFDIARDVDTRPPVRPAIAFDGAGTFLVVWQQGQRYFEQQQGNIMAARVDRSGRLLDAQPLVLSRASESQEAPQVEFSNGVFLVVWQDFRSGKHWDVYGTRVAVDGRIMDPGGIAIAVDADNKALPQVAAAPGGFLVVWQALLKGYYRIHGASVTAQGTASTFVLSHGGNPLYGGDPALARVASGWVLAWKDERAWSITGKGIITRRFARLAGEPSRPVVAAVHQAPAIWLGGAGGRFVGTRNHALYFSSEIAGRGQRVWTATLLDAATAAPLPNPNGKEAPSGTSSWDTTSMFPISTQNVAVDGIVAGDFGCGGFLLVARALLETKGRSANSLVAVHLGADGRRPDREPPWAVHNAVAALTNPVLRFGDGAFLLVFQEHVEDGGEMLRGKMLKCERP